jgi:hypothetical protein
MNVTVARYALGVAGLAIVCGSLAIAAVSLRRRFFADWTGALARLTESVIALALLLWIVEALGAVGWFRFAPIVAACVLVGSGTSLAVGGAEDAHARPALVRGFGSTTAPVLAAVAFLIAATVLAEWASPTLQSYDVGIRTFDSLWYHLPWAASFVQTGRITPLRFTDVQYLTAFYPATAELVHGVGITLFTRDTLSPAINLLWLAFALLAAWCVGRPRGVAPLTMAGAAVALGTPMMILSQAGSAANDLAGVGFLVAAVALLINGEASAPAYVLAAIAAGVAVGIKLSLLAPALALSLGAIVITSRTPAARIRRSRRRVRMAMGRGLSRVSTPPAAVGSRLRRPSARRVGTAGGRHPASAAALWIIPLLLAGAFWYVRNWIAVGNPLPWRSFGVFPTPAAALQQQTGFAVAHYVTDSHVWSAFFQPGLAAGLGRWWYLILAAVVVGPLLCLLPGAGKTVRMLGLVALASLAAYLLTPESAAGPAGDPAGFAFNLRYAAPALTLSLVVLPLAPPLMGPHQQTVLMAALVAVLVATVWQPSLWPSAHVAGAVVVGCVLFGLVLATRYAPRNVVVAGAALLAVAACVGGYPWQRHYLRGRYTFTPGFSYLARAWARFRTVRHARVGLVGTFGGFFSYPLYGLDLSNRVQYIAHRGPHGSFQPITSCAAWRSAVNAGNFRYVMTTPARDPWHPKALEPSPEGSWTGTDPAARVVYSRLALGQAITVYELRGPLDPSTCP